MHVVLTHAFFLVGGRQARAALNLAATLVDHGNWAAEWSVLCSKLFLFHFIY